MTYSPSIFNIDICFFTLYIKYLPRCVFQITLLEEGPQAFETLNGNRDFEDSPLVQLLKQISL